MRELRPQERLQYPDDVAIRVGERLVDAAWEELRRRPEVERQLGADLVRLPDVSFVEAERRSCVGRLLIERLDALNGTSLPHELALTLRHVRFCAKTWAREADWYWTVVDPLGLGFFGMFLPSAYCGGLLIHNINGYLGSFVFRESGDTDRYLALLADYARLVDQFTERTAEQANRGMWVPKAQVRHARALMAGFGSGVRAAVSVASTRLLRGLTGGFSREVESRLATRIEPAFGRAVDLFSDDYLRKAPDTVGMQQYTGGKKIYEELVRLHTTLDFSPEQVHAIGLARMAEIKDAMRAVRAELKFEGDDEAFLARLDTDQRWRAGTVEGVTAVFQRYIDRLQQQFKRYFSAEPKTPYGVVPLPDELQDSMTYGYYDVPRKDRAKGLYVFNAENLTKQPLFKLGTLTYHELVPGHHLHLATQFESESLHPFRKYSYVNAFAEGWAEYAATLAGEMGLYELPEERYGRLLMDAFLTCRLVVDTGMNAMGWSLEHARDYMRKHAGMTEVEIETESVRYSCDIPGQALAYKLGDSYLLDLREVMRYGLEEHFDVKDFHTAVLNVGALSLPDLRWHVEHVISRLLQAHRAAGDRVVPDSESPGKHAGER